MDDKHAGKGTEKGGHAQPQIQGQRRPSGRFGNKKGLPRSREAMHHGRLPEGNGATGKPAFFPPHP